MIFLDLCLFLTDLLECIVCIIQIIAAYKQHIDDYNCQDKTYQSLIRHPFPAVEQFECPQISQEQCQQHCYREFRRQYIQYAHKKNKKRFYEQYYEYHYRKSYRLRQHSELTISFSEYFFKHKHKFLTVSGRTSLISQRDRADRIDLPDAFPTHIPCQKKLRRSLLCAIFR